MRLKLDQNLPSELIDDLRRLGHDVEHVYTEGLGGHADTDVWSAAESEGRLLMTQDIGFPDARLFRPGEHAGFILIRMKQPGRQAVAAKVRAVFATEDVESWRGCIVVISDSKVRVRRPREG